LGSREVLDSSFRWNDKESGKKNKIAHFQGGGGVCCSYDIIKA